MKSHISMMIVRVFAFGFVGLLIVVGILLANIALQHKGFFAYHYDILSSREHATMQEELLALVKVDPTAAFVRFRGVLEDDPYTYNTCHGIAHQMGHVAYDTFGFQNAMAAQDALCGGGYIHGIIEARFGILQEEEIIGVLPTLCDDGNYSCDHGLGHGLMVATHLNIPLSLSFCKTLPDVADRNCYDGVWMHIFDLEESGAEHSRLSANAPDDTAIASYVALCNAAEYEYKTSCFFYLPRIFARHEEVSSSAYLSLCENVQADYQVTCAAGSGHSIMKYAIADPRIAFRTCETYSSPVLTSACKEGASLYYLFAAEGARCSSLSSEDENICNKVNGYRDQL